MDASNSKALYRRALVHHKMVRGLCEGLTWLAGVVERGDALLLLLLLVVENQRQLKHSLQMVITYVSSWLRCRATFRLRSKT